jgi:hypothetical protein
MLELEEMIDCCVGHKELGEKNKRGRNIWVHPVIRDRKNKGYFAMFRRSDERRSDIFNSFYNVYGLFEKLYENIKYSLQN